MVEGKSFKVLSCQARAFHCYGRSAKRFVSVWGPWIPRMGRDYPVEQMLDTLCKDGFAQAIALPRVAVELKFSSLPGKCFALYLIGWAGIDSAMPRPLG
jgi:hypothetical protein